MQQARESLGIPVTQESIEQIQAVRREEAANPIYRSAWMAYMEKQASNRFGDNVDTGGAARAVFDWLERIHSGRRVLFTGGTPDFIVEMDGGTQIGYEVRILRENATGFAIYSVLRYLKIPPPGISRVYILFVATAAVSDDMADSLIEGLSIPPWASLLFGHIELLISRSEPTFIPDTERPTPFGSHDMFSEGDR
jgi:hypothetical protein